MLTYPKIKNVYERETGGDYKLIVGKYSCEEFEKYSDPKYLWECTEKVDGTNVRVIFDRGEVKILGKRDRSVLRGDLVEEIQSVLPERRLDFIAATVGSERFCIYGEGYGAKIQGGGHRYAKSPKFVMFDLLVCYSELQEEWYWVTRNELTGIACDYDIDIVPYLGYKTFQEAVDMAAAGFNSAWYSPESHSCGFGAEGIIIKLVDFETDYTCLHRRVVGKIKSVDF